MDLPGEAEAGPAEGAGARTSGPPRELPIELLVRNPDQPRTRFSPAEMEELVQSIRENGILQPILVRPLSEPDGHYQIVAGERRWRAAQTAGLTAVPVVIRPLDDAQVLEIGIVENVQRADLDPIEEAGAYRILMDRFGRSQERVAEIVGKSRSHVANTLRLLALPAPVIEAVREGRLTAGHARALVTAADAQALAQRVEAEGLSVRQTEALAREAAGKPAGPARPAPIRAATDPDLAALERDISDSLGLEVAIVDRHGSGTLSIRYRSLEQLDEVLRRLGRPS